MNAYTKAEYFRLRVLGWEAKQALRAARVKDAFTDAEKTGLVKLETEIDCEPYDMSFYDTWDASERQIAHWKKITSERIDREGLYGLVSYVRNTKRDAWEQVDSCWGFIGDDWRDGGYDTDIMQACLDELDDIRRSEADKLAARATFAGVQ